MIAAWWNALALIGGCGVVLTLAEAAVPAQAQLVADRRPRLLPTFGWVAAYVAAAPLLAMALAPVFRGAARLGPWHGPLGSLPFVVRFAAAMLLIEVASYWLHRMLHATSWGRAVHGVHHRPNHVRWTASFRFHPAEVVVMHGLPTMLALMGGVGAGAVAAALTVVTVVTLFAHADVDCPRLGPVEAVVVTPAYHRVHHHIAPGHNFALVLPIVDRLFGTLASGTRPTRSTARQGWRHSPR